MLNDRIDYATSPARHAIRSLLFRTGLNARLGLWWWRPVQDAPYLSRPVDRQITMFAGMPTQFDDPDFSLRAAGDRNRWSVYRETITAADGVVVEPNRCQVIGPDGRLLSAFDPHRGLAVYPSAWQYRRRRIAHRLDEAIVFDGSAGRNLYHFVVDSLMALAWLDQEPELLASDLPLIINRRIADHAFFRHLCAQSPEFAALQWLVLEPGEFAAVGRAYNIRPAPFREELWRRVRGWYGTISVPRSRRLFVSRDAKRFGRNLRNESEVAEMLREYGFETFYPEHVSVAEQQATFEEAEVLVGLHGMALIQQIFMPFGQGRLLELMPRDRPQLEYSWISWMLRRRYYDVLVGSDLDAATAYEVDVNSLRQKVEQMLGLGDAQQQFGTATMSLQTT